MLEVLRNHHIRLSVLLLCASAIGLVSTQAQEADQATVQERWFGVLEAGQRHFRFEVALDKKGDAWSGKLKSLDEGGAEFDLAELKRSDDEFGFLIKVSNGRFEGKFDSDTSSANGHWVQGGAKLPLKFNRVEEFPKQKLKALWKGTINILVQKLDVQFRELEDGRLYFDSVGQRAGGFVAKRSEEDGKIVFEVPGVKGTFTGTLGEDGEKLEGKWKQGFVSPSLVLEKADVSEADAEAAGPNRPQTPKEPFPYTVKEVTFENEIAGIKLAGTMTVPKQGADPKPAVVMVSGSGPQDRDEALAGHKPFWVIADHFSRQGIAVLRFDDRGVGKSEGDYASATSVDLSTDAAAAVEYLRSLPEIDTKRIGICGHSEGGLIAPMVAAKDKDLAFVILMAGTGVNGEEILKSQSVLILKASGATERIIEQQSALQKALLKLALQDPPLTDRAFVEKAEELVVELTDAKEGSAEASAAAKAAAAQLTGPWMRYFLQYEPTTSLEKLSCAVLAINGSKDLQVDPDLNLPAIEKALKAAPTEDYKVVELDDLNHLFQHANTGSPSEYGDIEETFDPAALKLMSEWILGL